MPETVTIFDDAFTIEGDRKTYGRLEVALHDELSEFQVSFSFSDSNHVEICHGHYRAVASNPLDPFSILTTAATSFGLCVAMRYTGSTLKIVWRTYGEIKKKMPDGSAREHCVATFRRLPEKADDFKGEAISVLSSCSLAGLFPSE